MGVTEVKKGQMEALREKYEPVIGLEVHVQLRTASKIFCACSTRFGAPPNQNTCAVCLGMPGALPVLNGEAVAMAVKAALALNCRVNQRSIFARKNYFYPDLPKGYQISQFDLPLAEHGWLLVLGSGEETKIGITRLHMEEDAGKSIHDGFADSHRKTYVDLNRSGVPLVEIVSEPDITSPPQAHEYLTRLKQTLLYLDVSDCNMEEGSLRCDANVSVRPRGQQELGTKAEVKNLNSFRFVERALEYEIERQMRLVDEGGKVVQETRLWNSQHSRTENMRSKEEAHDYRYFPEPDLQPLIVSDEWRDEIRRGVPELPDEKRFRLIQAYGLRDYDAAVLTDSQDLADFYERVAKKSPDTKLAANWVMVELLGALHGAGKTIGDSPIPAEELAELIALIHEGTVSGKMAKGIFEQMFTTSKSARQIVEEQGLKQITDDGQILEIVRKVVAASPKQLEQYRAGKTTLIGFFVGQVMKETRGQANPKKVNDLLQQELERTD